MNEAKTIVKFGRIYGIADIIMRSAGIILTPLYTYVLSVSDYGVYALVFSATDIIGVFIGMGLSGAMGRFYFDYSEDSEMRNKVISTTLLGFFGVGMLLVVASYPLARVIVEVLFGSAEHTNIFALAIAGILFGGLLEIEMGYFLIQKRAMLYLGVAIGKAVLFLLTNAFFFLYLELGVLGIIASTVSSFGILSTVMGIKVFKKVGGGFSFDIFKQLLSFGLPLLPPAIAGTGIQMTQRYFLNILAGPAAVGIVALATRLASMLQMFIAAPFFKIFIVRRFETLTEGKDQSDLNQILLIFVAVISAGGLFLGLFGNEIIYIIAPDAYKNVALYIPLLCLAIMISVIERNFGIGLFYQKKTKVFSVIAITAFIISVPSNYFLILHFGPMGAVFAFLLVCIVRLIMIVRANSRMGVAQVQLDWLRSIIILSLVSLISTLGYQYWGDAITLPLVTFKAGLLGFFMISLIGSPLLDAQSRKIIISLLREATARA